MTYEDDDNNQQANSQRLRQMVQEQMRRNRLEEQKKEIVKRLLEPDAYERLMNIRASNRQLWSELMDLIISLAQSNRISGRMTDKQFVAVLGKVNNRPEPTLTFKHK